MKIRRVIAILWLGLPGPLAAQPFDVPDIPQCFELVPGAVSIDDTPVTLSLRVVLDGVSQGQAEQAVGAARAAYVPLNIALGVSYESAGFQSSEGLALIEEAKRHYGGRRPSGTHAVYVITAKDLYFIDETGQRDTTLVGVADCIGGVAYAEHAFAVGEAVPDDPFSIVYSFGRNLAGKTLGHEVGHLLGGHHHYANCVETLSELDDATCTLMINDLGLAALRFSTLNGLTVRGHAQLAGSPGFAQTSESSSGGGGTVSLVALLILMAGGLAPRATRSGARGAGPAERADDIPRPAGTRYGTRADETHESAEPDPDSGPFAITPVSSWSSRTSAAAEE